MKTSLLQLSAAFLIFAGSARAQDEEVIHAFDFTTQKDGNAMAWLVENGFEFKLSFEKLNPRFENGALHFSTDVPQAGLAGYIFPEGKDLAGVQRVRITWGVNHFPDGANWEEGVNRIPVAIMISFGRERLSSGIPFGIQAAPYFIGPFIGEKETEGKVYTGKLWKLGGRYVCAKAPSMGEPVVSEFNLEELFKSSFGKEVVPKVSAVGFQMNSKNTAGKAGAFIKKIEFLGPPAPAPAPAPAPEVAPTPAPVPTPAAE